jgi:integrase
VRKLCEDFLTGHIERYRDSLGAAQSRRRIMTKIAPIAGLPAASITRKQAFDLLDGERQAPRNAAILRSELGAAWDYALDAGRVPEDTPNWWRQVMRGKLRSVGRKRGGKVENVKRVLSEDELAILVPWLSKLSETISDVLTMYLWTGLRGGEIVVMEGKEMSKESDGLWWTIPKAKTKNKNRTSATDHRVPLAGRAEKIVQRRLGLYGKGYLFPTADKPPYTSEKRAGRCMGAPTLLAQAGSDVATATTCVTLGAARSAPHVPNHAGCSRVSARGGRGCSRPRAAGRRGRV